MREMETEEPESEEDFLVDEDMVLEYEIDPEMSDRISKLKSDFIKPIHEGMSSIEHRLERAQEMLKRVQDLDQLRESQGEPGSDMESDEHDLEDESEEPDEMSEPELEDTDEDQGQGQFTSFIALAFQKLKGSEMQGDLLQ